ncbi:hypothetical protein A4X13_0g3274 [Tilletia indica]|uniref:Uncharacterized protein n=1 Tax=Tilletia indica TaxID=43049 RepID=A0A8T8T2Q7_9BASI|nr:hypothetical protein A4X13_0g3274 [Tilletia indica]
MADRSVIRDADEFKDSKSLSFWYFGLPKHGKPRVMRDRQSFARSTGCLRATTLESDTCARYTGATEAGNQNVTRIVEWRLKTNTDSISSLIKELIVTTNQSGLVGRQDPRSCHRRSPAAPSRLPRLPQPATTFLPQLEGRMVPSKFAPSSSAAVHFLSYIPFFLYCTSFVLAPFDASSISNTPIVCLTALRRKRQETHRILASSFLSTIFEHHYAAAHSASTKPHALPPNFEFICFPLDSK